MTAVAPSARPEAGVDAALAAAQIAVSLQSIVARNVPPVQTAVLSVTRIHAGDAYNVIPQTATLGGTVRAFSRDVMALVEGAMRRVARGTAEAFDATAELDFRELFAPTVNDAAEAQFAARICRARRQRQRRAPAAADHGLGRLLVHARARARLLHQHRQRRSRRQLRGAQPLYDFNDAALPLGAAFFAPGGNAAINRARAYVDQYLMRARVVGPARDAPHLPPAKRGNLRLPKKQNLRRE
jgi:metal-dependent amidase/aminoacylase/carboxypeptidase family protein